MKLFWSFLLCAAAAFAQSGDKAGEVQAPPPATLKIPRAPSLSVEDALKTFQLAPGFSIEVVASEPLIEAPVETEFAPDGSLYVLEMRGFMPNVDGTGEDQPVGRVSLLRDTDGDGRMDKASVFAEGLVMPRAICVTRGGLLVAEPPHLWFFKDTNGDDEADEKTPVSNDYGTQKNPEHEANGLLWGRDNWIYSANHTVRYRNLEEEWEKQPTTFRGQWGISQDDYGRLYFNSNSDQLRVDLVPTHYLSRNPNFRGAFGGNVQIAKDQSAFPIRVNPGVNRGYQQGTLKPDGTLARFTGACGPVIYRGELFPREFYGAAFLCEPTANMVRCNFVREQNGILTATNAFPGREFLASTDERFRPVNLLNGPDGALYVVDMYRGVIQHRIYITTFLRNQALDRGLDKPLNLGRIYRVVPTGAQRPTPTTLAKLTAEQLVEKLGVTNGWARDTAQQLLVERRDRSVVPGLVKVAATGAFPSAIHAMWVLNALGETEGYVGALESRDGKVRATAVRMLEPYLRLEGRNPIKTKLFTLTNDPAFDTRLQLMFSLRETKDLAAESAMISLLERDLESALMRDAAVSGLGGRELPFLDQLLAHANWRQESSARKEIIRDLAASIAASREALRIEALLDFAANRPAAWQQSAMIEGIATLLPPRGRNKEAPQIKPVRFAAEPTALAKLAAQKELQPKLANLNDLLAWPGKAGVAVADVKPLTEAEQKLFEAGKTLYPTICGACHQPHGLGQDGLAPPLVESDWVNGAPSKLVRIVLQGIRGPLNVKGKIWELEMPGLGVLSDEEIASLLTYVRREWGHTSAPISPEVVANIRKETEERFEAWTEPELLKLKD